MTKISQLSELLRMQNKLKCSYKIKKISPNISSKEGKRLIILKDKNYKLNYRQCGGKITEKCQNFLL